MVKPIDYVMEGRWPSEEKLKEPLFNKDFWVYTVLKEYYNKGILCKKR